MRSTTAIGNFNETNVYTALESNYARKSSERYSCFSWVPVIEYIESKYEEFLNAESRVVRRQIPDSRVHCCLYFVAPSGHGLKPLDVEFMQRLHDKVNIIPVIAKADTMTPDECAHFKKQVRIIE